MSSKSTHLEQEPQPGFGLQAPPSPGELLGSIEVKFFRNPTDGTVDARVDESPSLTLLFPNALMLMAQLVVRYSAALVNQQAVQTIKQVQAVSANQIAIPRNG